MEERYQEIDLLELVGLFIKKWWLLVGLFLIFGVVTYIITDKYVTPVYYAETTLYTGKEPNEISGVGISLSEFQISSQLLNDYRQIVKTRLVAEEVIKNLNIDLSVHGFTKSLSINSIADSRLFKVGFLHTDPKVAAQVSNELAEQLSIAVYEIVGVENIRIIDKAIVPKYPIKPNKVTNAVVAGIIGFVIGSLIIIILKLMNNTITKEEEVEQLIGLPALAVIPKFQQDLITITQPHSYIAEKYKMFRTNLNYINIDDDKKVLLFTSSIAEEGKSTTVCNVAITIAQTDKKVLLIDGDLRRPKIHNLLNIESIPGLTNVLSKIESLIDVIKPIPSVKGLDILTAGVLPPTPAELLASIRFKELIELAKDRYDYILIDAPPTLSVTDTATISSVVDGVVLIVAAHKTAKSLVINSKKALEKVGVNLLGVVLTKMNHDKYASYYKHYFKK